MEELFISPYALALIFFVVSAAYSSVGLGGGSSYTALLAVFGASHRAIPPISLTLNIVVTLMGTINYVRAGHARARLIATFVITSVPMAYLGGRLEVEQRSFMIILTVLLALVAARIYFWRQPMITTELKGRTRVIAAAGIGAVLGLVSGMVGIGGGIFLVPLIILLGLGDQKEAAAAGAIFILLNSIAGLGAHLQRHVPDYTVVAPLVAAVLVGGFLGSYLGSSKLDRAVIQRILGVIIVVAVVLLTLRVI